MDFTLTSEQRHLQRIAREFARNRLRPAAQRLDAATDPVDTYPEDLIEEASSLGLRTLSLPVEWGGWATDELTETIVLEELCYGDVGFGMTIAHPWREGRMIADHASASTREAFLRRLTDDPKAVTSLAITEEHSGSDNALPFTGTSDSGPRTTAVREGDGWVLNGRKRWITSGNTSTLLIIAARTDPSMPWTEGISLFVVPRETQGLRVGVIEDKLGIRLNQNAEVILEDCRVPQDHMLGAENEGGRILRDIAPSSKAKEAAKSLGIGQAAFEAAFGWAHQRVQGGVPIAQHGSVGNALAEMAAQLELTRSLVWRAAWASDHDPEAAHLLSDMAKVTASRTVATIGARALELHGSAGIRRGNDAERLLRDAVSMLHAPAGNDALLARIHTAIQDGRY